MDQRAHADSGGPHGGGRREAARRFGRRPAERGRVSDSRGTGAFVGRRRSSAVAEDAAPFAASTRPQAAQPFAVHSAATEEGFPPP